MSLQFANDPVIMMIFLINTQLMSMHAANDFVFIVKYHTFDSNDNSAAGHIKTNFNDVRVFSMILMVLYVLNEHCYLEKVFYPFHQYCDKSLSKNSN